MKSLDSTIFAVTQGRGLYISTNWGNNWEMRNNGIENLFLRAIGFRENKIYVAAQKTTTHSAKIYFSTDFGSNWAEFITGINTAGSVHSFVWINDMFFICYNDKGVYKSTNNGATWVECNNGIDNMANFSTMISHQNVLLLGTNTGHGVYRSTDFGESWHLSNNGLTNTYAKSPSEFLVVDSTIYMATSGGGMFYSTNIGESWVEINGNLSIKFVFSIAQYNKNIFIGTMGGKVFKLNNQDFNWYDLSSGLATSDDFHALHCNPFYLIAGNSYGFFRIPTNQVITNIFELNHFEPKDFNLFQNYPNPFNPSTKISWQTPIGSHTTLKIYDVLGNEVATLVDEYKEAGNYEVEFNVGQAISLSSGVYFYKLQTGNFVQTRKMMLLK